MNVRDTAQADFRQFVSRTDEAGLASQLTTIAAQRRLGRVCVGLMVYGRELFAADEGAQAADRGAPGDALIRAGCLAKPLTATLIAHAVETKRIHWHDPVAEMLETGNAAGERLPGVTVLHLLNHTHGLDVSLMDQVPRTPDGYIDLPGLCAGVGARPLAPPGDLYSYSNAGAWLAGALLERIHRRTYSELLRDWGVPPGSADSSAAPLQEVCPATGAGLQLTCRQWLGFLRCHVMQASWSCGPEPGGTEEIALPGWSLFERGICRGWKTYGGGWLGHNSNTEGCSAVVRFHPRDHAAVIVCAETEGSAVFALTGILGSILPEFADLKVPRLLRGTHSQSLPPEPFTGIYSRSDSRVIVIPGARSPLGLSVEDLRSGLTSPCRNLRPAENDLFILEPREDPRFPLLQFLRPDAAGRFEYIWNGKQLWRRE